MHQGISVYLAKQISISTLVLMCFYSGCKSNDKLAISGQQHYKASEVLESLVQILTVDTLNGKWVTWGTGVVLNLDSTKNTNYLITNRHVLVGMDSLRIIYNVYLNDSTNFVKFLRVPKIIYPTDSRKCTLSKKYDLGVYEVGKAEKGIPFDPMMQNKFIDFDSLEYGLDVEFFGFPLYNIYGIDNTNWTLPICRSGTLAYFANEDVQDFKGNLILQDGMFLVDGTSLPGNSGGPIFLLTSDTFGGPKSSRYRFIGIVAGSLLAPLANTRQLVENSQLVYAYSIDLIKEVAFEHK